MSQTDAVRPTGFGIYVGDHWGATKVAINLMGCPTLRTCISEVHNFGQINLINNAC